MVLVSQASGRPICLECGAVLQRGEDEEAWMAVHLGDVEGAGCTVASMA